jgi:ubiquitin C-terminal hydrolase
LTFDEYLTIEHPDESGKGAPRVYDLFSVLVHSGGAMGGHYYAFIRPLDTGWFERARQEERKAEKMNFTIFLCFSDKWFKFDDSIVSEVTQNDVKVSFSLSPSVELIPFDV